MNTRRETAHVEVHVDRPDWWEREATWPAMVDFDVGVWDVGEVVSKELRLLLDAGLWRIIAAWAVRGGYGYVLECGDGRGAVVTAIW